MLYVASVFVVLCTASDVFFMLYMRSDVFLMPYTSHRVLAGLVSWKLKPVELRIQIPFSRSCQGSRSRCQDCSTLTWASGFPEFRNYAN